MSTYNRRDIFEAYCQKLGLALSRHGIDLNDIRDDVIDELLEAGVDPEDAASEIIAEQALKEWSE
jgi:hypothetical protein